MNYVNELRDRVAPLQADLLGKLKELVAFDSVEAPALPGKPFGQAVHDALEFVLQLGRDMGFEARNLEGYVGIIEWGKGEELIGILSHVDIVPTGDPSDWESPALQMQEREGYVYGRGVADDKGPLLSVLYGMKALKDMGYEPQKRLQVIIGTNEETKWGCMKYFVEHCEIPSASFSPDGMFTVVNREKGICGLTMEKAIEAGGVTITGGTARNVVPALCKATLKNVDEATVRAAIAAMPAVENRSYSMESTDGAICVTCKGKSAGALNPQAGVNAIEGMLAFITRCDAFAEGLQKDAAAIVRLLGDTPDGSAMGVACSDEESGAMTTNLGVLSLENGKLSMQLDFRTPVTASISNIAGRVYAFFEKEGYAKVGCDIKEPLYVPADLPLIKKLCGVYEAVTGDKAELLSIGGGTYARAFGNCCCFGACYSGEALNIHMPNERALIKNILQNCIIYGAAIRELTQL